MGMEKLLSIIVPAYNGEKYLEKCITSIIDQSYKNLEIILIDDKSPDLSGEICEKFAMKESRYFIIKKIWGYMEQEIRGFL